MYKKEIITRPDGTKCVQITRVNKEEVVFTEDQLRMQRAIEAFGTSA
jgi:hypothetical protein